MTWTIVLWAILVGGPLLGILATVALAVYHEHGDPRRQGAADRQAAGLPLLPAPPQIVRRSSTALLEDYLLDDRDATIAVRRRRHARLLVQTERASTEVFQDFMDDRLAGQGAPAPTPAPVRAPVPVIAPAPAPLPVRRVAARVPARVPVRVAAERAARPTRLVPLAPEIAIG